MKINNVEIENNYENNNENKFEEKNTINDKENLNKSLKRNIKNIIKQDNYPNKDILMLIKMQKKIFKHKNLSNEKVKNLFYNEKKNNEEKVQDNNNKNKDIIINNENTNNDNIEENNTNKEKENKDNNIKNKEDISSNNNKQNDNLIKINDYSNIKTLDIDKKEEKNNNSLGKDNKITILNSLERKGKKIFLNLRNNQKLNNNIRHINIFQKNAKTIGNDNNFNRYKNIIQNNKNKRLKTYIKKCFMIQNKNKIKMKKKK